MDVDDAISVLKSLPDISEAYQVTTFKCIRRAKDGGDQEITVEVWDAGEGAGNTRYQVFATAPNGNGATGNPMASVDTALRLVHWYKLDG